MIRIVFSVEAEVDALSSFKFYEERREGLGERFRDHVSRAWAGFKTIQNSHPSSTETRDDD